MSSDRRGDLADILDESEDPLADRREALEDRFLELEREAELEKMRTAAGPKDEEASLQGEPVMERYLLVVCPFCSGKNRLSLSRVRSKNPICGHCKKDLSFTKT
jgi:hypothetical protein